MNIQAAAVYLNVGYRLRRPTWHNETYIKCNYMGEIEMYCRQEHWTIGGLDGLKHHTYISGGSHDLTIKDLLAEDWELITTGIRKYFSNHEHGMEYDDDTDWDNYVPPKSSWDGDDED